MCVTHQKCCGATTGAKPRIHAVRKRGAFVVDQHPVCALGPGGATKRSTHAFARAAPGEVEIAAVADPTPAPGEVVVEVAGCGLCGTDLHILRGEFAPHLPLVPGHEFAGTVAAVGSGVDRVAAGARVAVDPSLYCYRCHYCRAGRNNLCENWGAIGVTTAGAAAEYVAVPAANCVPIPDELHLADAALIEPLSCAVRGYDVLATRLGAHVLIYGAGTMGLMMLQLAKRVGATSVDIVDVNDGSTMIPPRSVGSVARVRQMVGQP